MKQFFIVALIILIISIGFGSIGISPIHAAGDANPGVGNGDPNAGVGNGDANPGVQANPIIIPNPIKATSIQALFSDIMDILLVFAIPLIAFFIIYAGFLYVTASGNPEKIETANKALLYALIGGVLILGANVLITVIKGTVDSFRTASLIIGPFLG